MIAARLAVKNTLLRQQEEDFLTGNQAPSGSALYNHSEIQLSLLQEMRMTSSFTGLKKATESGLNVKT
jgi:hypothetical protein